MRPVPLVSVITFILTLFISFVSQGQSFGINSSAVWLTDCNQSNYFNTSGSGAGLIGPTGNVFTNASLGSYTQNSGTLTLGGAEIRTFKDPSLANVCNTRMYYRIYLQSAAPGGFNPIDLSLTDNCNVPTSQFPSGGSCVTGDQKWSYVFATPVNLTTFAPGNYVLEVYYDVTGSSASTTLCDETVVLNNGGNNYKAFFSIQAPVLSSTNPTTCNGTEGSITIGGLTAGTTYSVTYADDGVTIGPNNYVADGSGQVIISGLDAGVYTDFAVGVSGCTTQLNTGLILSNPVRVPSFNAFVPFCQGTTPPTLPTTSNNGITGTWSPSVVNNNASGTYTFTPDPGQCAITITRNITVNPRTTPTFSFGTSRTICAGGSVPALSTTSTNGITGTWSPAVVDDQNSATYTFTPDAGLCATSTTFTVTVNPNITPTFSFGTSLTICAGGIVPGLPTSSSNGITGTWSPATVDNQVSGTYTFTPTAGQCATTTTYTVTVNPNTTPTFSFGTSLSICAGGSVPALPNTSNNGINGTWSPSVVDNQNSGVYTFTPAAGPCAIPVSFSVTVNPNVTPTFSFGTSLTICAGGSVPTLSATSTNGITGTWSPASVDDQNSGTYTFTPDAGQCATTATFSVTVTPNITPTFSFGTSLTVCAGGSVPALPNTSTNGINGTWSPSTVDDQASATYTFTPAAGQCATTTTFTVTVNPNITPTFSFGTSLTICAGGSVPALPNTSTNGINGTWSPSTVDDQASATYTFTPAAGQCATVASYTVTVTPNIIPTFSFGTSLSICEGGAVPSLSTTSTNGITGTWSPSTVDNTVSGTYTFTPDAGQCAVTAGFTVTVNPILTPTFSFGTVLSICAGGSVPTLSATSTNGITGTWSPASVDDQNSGTYTFTPTAGQCATTTTFTVSVNSNTSPTFSFGTSLTICAGGSVPALPATSTNGVSGTWSPSTVDNQASGTYTFTPAAGQCATAATFAVTVNPNVTPAFSFGTSLTICAGGSVPALPGASTNGISGTWSPAVVDNQNSSTYTFTPDAGLCATATTFRVTVNPNVTPVFSFGTTLTICAGGSAPTLPNSSTNGITGTWSPSTVDNQNSGTYTFTPDAGQCVTGAVSFSVTVNPNTIPAFSFGTTLTICAGGSVPVLPGTSTNGVTGTWNPSVVDNQASGVYTFSPAAGPCATAVSFTVTVNPNITPAFSFGTSLSICEGGTVPSLPATSSNGITGTWSPASVDNMASGTYTFTPDAGQCATVTTFSVTVNPNITPTFSFGTSLTICAGSSVPTLSTTSTNGVTGTWSPASVDNQNSGTYTFTPAAGQCATTTTFTVTVNPNTIPTFSFGTSLTICAGGTVPALPTTSTNGIAGTWSPAVVNNQASGVYTFTPAVMPGQCIVVAKFTVTVNQIVTPTFSFDKALTLCAGATAPVLPNTSTNGITGTWNPSVISNQNSGTYTFTSTAGQCADPTTTVTVAINPLPTVNVIPDTAVFDEAIVPSKLLSGVSAGASFTWTNSNPAIGLAGSGTGTIPSFTAINKTNNPVSATISVTPTLNGCVGQARTYVITVKPLDKDVFVPNVFSPNGDGKNDLLLVYGNYIDQLDMRIFNQWGEQVQRITNKATGWDGRHQGKPQPVGVYVYTLRAVLTDGRTVNLKGTITLLR